MPREVLSLSERVQIEKSVDTDESPTALGRRLGRACSTITREFERNGGRINYSAAAADGRACEQRPRPRLTVFEKDRVLAAHVEARLVARDSPMTISIELDHDLYPDVSGRVSHETIYTGVYAHGTAGLAKGLHTRLHRHRRCRKHRRAPGVEPVTRGPLGECTPIGLRPAEAETRTRIGDFEGDLICGSFNRSAIVTMFDRCSRKVWLASLPEGHGAEPTLAALLELFERIEERFHRTLTWDRGSEMAHHDLLAEETGLDIYFAEPHSPWQRGTNENGNGLLRRYLPKGTNLGVYTETDLRAIETRLNTMPRRSLGWQTAQHVYDHHPLR